MSSNALKLVTLLSGGGPTPHAAYKSTVLGVQAANLIAYWPLDELSGTNADNAEGTAARDGTYNGVTLDATDGPFTGGRAGSWDGTNDTCDIYSTSLNTALNGSEGCLSLWAKASAVGVWTDSVARSLFRLDTDSSSQLIIDKSATNLVRALYVAGGTADGDGNITHGSPTGWLHLAFTWSVSNDRVKVYVDGTQENPTHTTLGTWAGNIVSTKANIGALNSTPTQVWSGNLAHVALWTIELTAENITTLYNGGPS